MLTDSNKSLFSALAVKEISSPSTSLASKLTLMFSPSSSTEAGSAICDNSGASLTFKTSTSKEVDSEDNPPSIAVTIIVHTPI